MTDENVINPAAERRLTKLRFHEAAITVWLPQIDQNGNEMDAPMEIYLPIFGKRSAGTPQALKDKISVVIHDVARLKGLIP